ncbi:IucA/IucC family protein [Metabacillus lacus]|nr:IucA/IucC family protein [Metabacillus lacus]
MKKNISSQAESRVRRQLAEALLFEELLPYEERGEEFILYGKHTYLFTGKRSAWDRIRLDEKGIFVVKKGKKEEADIHDLLKEISGNDEIYSEVAAELEQTVKFTNHTLQLERKHRSTLSYEELEAEIDEGHRYHPCFKSRSGFSLEDSVMYGPEHKSSFALGWLAVRRDQCHLALPCEETAFWKKELGSELYQMLTGKLSALTKDTEKYTLLPVHPWQWENIKYSLLKEALEKKHILWLGEAGPLYRATTSVRTLFCVENPERAHIKLSMNMRNTSSLRTLPVHSVYTAPEVSDWLQNLVNSDPYLKKRMLLLREYAGAVYCPYNRGTEREAEGQLGVIWRESVRAKLQEKQSAAPFTALYSRERDESLFLKDWLTMYGTEEWMMQFIKTAVLPVWHLLAAHGAAVEAHAQNMVLIHENGWPAGVILRDFHESVEYTAEFLANGVLPEFETSNSYYRHAPDGKYYRMANVEALRELVMDTLFVFHLSELSYVLEAEGCMSENRFWNMVSDLIEEHVEYYDLKSRHELLEFDKEKIFAESLLKKRLCGKKEEECRHLVNNPFFSWKKGRQKR